MNDNDLRQSLRDYQKRYGASITFVATTCGVSREHLSRWMHNRSYSISCELKNRLFQFTAN
jgi:transcriptional regulator with XRE-family HTH domain